MNQIQIEQLVSKYESFQEKLLQTNTKNRCILLSRIYKKHTFDLSMLEKIDTSIMEKIIDRALKSKKAVCILQDSDDSEDAESMWNSLYALSKNLKQIEDETGTQYGYLAYSFLEGHITKNFYVRAPLILIPISLEYKRNGRPAGWYLNFSDSVPILNQTLLVVLKEKGGFQINDDLDVFAHDFLEDLKTSKENLEVQFFKNLENLVSSMGCKILQNSEYPLEKLSQLGKEDLDKLEQQPLCIKNYKIIGNFPQGDSKIYEDYNELIEKAKNANTHTVINELLEIERDEIITSFDDRLDIDNPSDDLLHTVLDSDSSQDKIIISSQNNTYTVVKGPPGTGKSQVIVNIISNALSNGQKVLVICQKRVALEVVHQRLNQVKLGKYSVLLAKEKDDRTQIYQQLKQIIQQGNGHYYGTTNVESISKQIDNIIKSQSTITDALTTEYFGGITVRELYLKTDKNYKPILDISSLVDKIHFHSLEQFLSKIGEVEDGYKSFEIQNYPWYNRTDFSVLTRISKNNIEEILQNIIKLIPESLVVENIQKQDLLVSLIREYCNLSSNSDTLSAELSKIRNNMDKLLLNSQQLIQDYDNSLQRIKLGQTLWDEFKFYEKITQTINDPYLERTWEKQQEVFDAIIKYRKNNSFIKIKRLINAEIREAEQVVKTVLNKPQNSGKDLDYVTHKVENGLFLWNCLQSLENIHAAIENSIILSSQSGQSQLIDNMINYKVAEENLTSCAKRMGDLLEKIRNIFQESKLNFQDTKLKEYEQLAKKGFSMFDNLKKLYTFLNKQGEKEFEEIKSQPNDLLNKTLSMMTYLQDFEKIQDHDLRKTELSQEHTELLYQCSRKFDKSTRWKDAVRQEIFYTWINYIEAKFPLLRTYYFENHSSTKDQLRELFQKKNDAIINKITGEVQSRVTIGKKRSRHNTDREIRTGHLEHELGKKKNVMPVRKLLQDYGDILLDISPCWLASPEIVSNIFPLEKNIFDLIIVDEASQLAVERSLPVLFRGKRIVIAGDEMQLKPFDLFKYNENDEDEEDETLNIESLLVLASRANPKKNELVWHYRSKWQELIDFSNHAFYRGNLHIFPNVIREHRIVPIRWIKCDGIWEERANIVEAEKIIELILIHMTTHKDDKEFPSLGIITFNERQRDEIQKRIDDKRKIDSEFDKLCTKFFDLPKDQKDKEIFIKNIENVQGDERDIIIFSVGYAKDKEGNNVRSQFGTLNKNAGENRLNVAVTRAREETIMVSSIEPEEINLEAVKSIGPQRLKDFLRYAKQVSENQKEQVKQLLSSLLPIRSNQDYSNVRDEFEQMVAQKIRSRGYEVISHYGSSDYKIDLAVVHPHDHQKFILGLECDGDSLHVLKSIRDRDVMIPKFLEKRGWNLMRTWSRNWWQDPDRELDRIIKKIDDLIKSPHETQNEIIG